MPTIDQYTDNNDKLRLLLQGEPGSGKTHLAAQFPRPWFIDADLNLGGVIRELQRQRAEGKQVQLPVGYDVVDRTDAGVVIPIGKRYDHMGAILAKLTAEDKNGVPSELNASIDTIVFDSGTTLVDIFIAKIMLEQNVSFMSKREWGFFGLLCKKFFNELTTCRKHVVFIVHEKIMKDSNGNVVMPLKVNWPGQVGELLGALFTNVWRCEAKSKAVSLGQPHQMSRILRTQPNGVYTLKNTLGLPAEFEFSWEKIEQALTPLGKKI